MNRRDFLRVAAGAAGVAALAGRPALATLREGGTTLGLAWAEPRTPGEWQALSHFDLTHFGDGRGAEVLLWPGDAARLAESGIPFRVTEEDLIGRDSRRPSAPRSLTLAAQPGERGAYRHLAEYDQDLINLAKARPEIARLITLPLTSREGRPVRGIEIAEAVGRPDGRPTFYMDGIHHAREWPSGEMAIMFAHDLVSGYGRDPRTTGLLRDLRVVIVPVVNPDGFVYSRQFAVDVDDAFLSYPIQAIGFGSYWRKNRRSLAGDRGLGRTDQGLTSYGVDPNRNYSLHWGGPGTRPYPVDLTYPGEAPFSEPESRNVATAVLGRTVTAVVSNHTYSDLILRPWGDTRSDCPDEALLRQLGSAMQAHNDYRNIKGIDLYPTTGTMSDWAYATTGALAYTFEHGSPDVGFHPPYLRHIPDYYVRNREPFFMMAAAAADPAHHSVIRGRTLSGGKGVAAAVRLRRVVTLERNDNELHADMQEIAVSSDADGRFEIHVGPSSQPSRDPAQAYELIAGKAKVGVIVRRGEKVDLGRIPLG